MKELEDYHWIGVEAAGVCEGKGDRFLFQWILSCFYYGLPRAPPTGTSDWRSSSFVKLFENEMKRGFLRKKT